MRPNLWATVVGLLLLACETPRQQADPPESMQPAVTRAEDAARLNPRSAPVSHADQGPTAAVSFSRWDDLLESLPTDPTWSKETERRGWRVLNAKFAGKSLRLRSIRCASKFCKVVVDGPNPMEDPGPDVGALMECSRSCASAFRYDKGVWTIFQARNGYELPNEQGMSEQAQIVNHATPSGPPGGGLVDAQREDAQ